MNITCVYTVETYNSIEKPMGVATEIPFGIAMIVTVLENAGNDVELLVITPDTPLDKYIKDNINKKKTFFILPNCSFDTILASKESC